MTKDNPPIIVRKIEWGGMLVEIGEVRQTCDSTTKDEGQSGNPCQKSHWGYFLERQIRVKFGAREEVRNTGDVFFVPPWHMPGGYYEAGPERLVTKFKKRATIEENTL